MTSDQISPCLAARGIIFDHAYCQVAVCAPSRNSLLTGLRPDTLGSYDFYPLDPREGYIMLPQRLAAAGYRTAGYGKLLHREDVSLTRHQNWNVEQVEKDWYRYQSREYSRMNASVSPDYNTPEEDFRYYIFTSMAISRLRNLTTSQSKDHARVASGNSGGSGSSSSDTTQQPFMLSLGFKLPHLTLHIPGKYFDLHAPPSPLSSSSAKAAMTPEEHLVYPPSAPILGFTVSNEKTFR